MVARSKEKIDVLRAELADAKAIYLDAADKLGVEKSFAELEKAGEKIDICINNAGIAALTPIFGEEDNADFESIIQTNLMGVWYVTTAIAKHMKQHGIHGSIINIASVNGANKLHEGLASYTASMAAVIQLTKALVGELSPYNIRINCISPGLFYTPLTDYKLSTEGQRKTMERIIPLGFVAKPEDLNGALLLLASNSHSRYITGTCITVDGGISWGG